jgi:hypothetical protein
LSPELFFHLVSLDLLYHFLVVHLLLVQRLVLVFPNV